MSWGKIARMRKATPFLATVLFGLVLGRRAHAQQRPRVRRQADLQVGR